MNKQATAILIMLDIIFLIVAYLALFNKSGYVITNIEIIASIASPIFAIINFRAMKSAINNKSFFLALFLINLITTFLLIILPIINTVFSKGFGGGY